MEVFCIRKYLAISVSLSIKYPRIHVIHIYNIICLLHVVKCVHIISIHSILTSYLYHHFSVSLRLGRGGETLQYCKTTTTSKIITFSDIFNTVRKLQNLMLSFYRNPNLERKLYNYVPVENFQTCRKILIKKIRISSAIYNFENITLLFLVLVPLHVIIGLKKKNQYERKCDGRHTSLRSSCRSIFFPKKTTL